MGSRCYVRVSYALLQTTPQKLISAISVYIAGGVSGAHLSPAVTTALAVFRGFPWRKVPGYFLAQLLGAMVGSIFIQANYKNLIDQFEGCATLLLLTRLQS
jgi:glycerol uptake facilitator-like aquaporin